MYKLIIAFLTLALSCTAQANEQTFGFSASTFSGSGFSYKRKLDENYQVKASGFMFGSKTSGSESFSYNLGCEAQRNLHQANLTRFYGLLGLSYWDDKTTSPAYDSLGNLTGQSMVSRTREMQLGTGIGVEVTLLENISINADAGFKYQKSLNNGDYQVGFGLGAGLGYTF
ncbi:MAG: hypothetical protein HOO97_01550 [Sideroxydans sp.]|nr:hypothetical protein [Sideroxydans sp.]